MKQVPILHTPYTDQLYKYVIPASRVAGTPDSHFNFTPEFNQEYKAMPDHSFVFWQQPYSEEFAEVVPLDPSDYTSFAPLALISEWLAGKPSRVDFAKAFGAYYRFPRQLLIEHANSNNKILATKLEQTPSLFPELFSPQAQFAASQLQLSEPLTKLVKSSKSAKTTFNFESKFKAAWANEQFNQLYCASLEEYRLKVQNFFLTAEISQAAKARTFLTAQVEPSKLLQEFGAKVELSQLCEQINTFAQPEFITALGNGLGIFSSLGIKPELQLVPKLTALQEKFLAVQTEITKRNLDSEISLELMQQTDFAEQVNNFITQTNLAATIADFTAEQLKVALLHLVAKFFQKLDWLDFVGYALQALALQKITETNLIYLHQYYVQQEVKPQPHQHFTNLQQWREQLKIWWFGAELSQLEQPTQQLTEQQKQLLNQADLDTSKYAGARGATLSPNRADKILNQFLFNPWQGLSEQAQYAKSENFILSPQTQAELEFSRQVIWQGSQEILFTTGFELVAKHASLSFAAELLEIVNTLVLTAGNQIQQESGRGEAKSFSSEYLTPDLSLLLEQSIEFITLANQLALLAQEYQLSSELFKQALQALNLIAKTASKTKTKKSTNHSPEIQDFCAEVAASWLYQQLQAYLSEQTQTALFQQLAELVWLKKDFDLATRIYWLKFAQLQQQFKQADPSQEQDSDFQRYHQKLGVGYGRKFNELANKPQSLKLAQQNLQDSFYQNNYSAASLISSLFSQVLLFNLKFYANEKVKFKPTRKLQLQALSHHQLTQLITTDDRVAESDWVLICDQEAILNSDWKYRLDKLLQELSKPEHEHVNQVLLSNRNHNVFRTHEHPIAKGVDYNPKDNIEISLTRDLQQEFAALKEQYQANPNNPDLAYFGVAKEDLEKQQAYLTALEQALAQDRSQINYKENPLFLNQLTNLSYSGHALYLVRKRGIKPRQFPIFFTPDALHHRLHLNSNKYSIYNLHPSLAAISYTYDEKTTAENHLAILSISRFIQPGYQYAEQKTELAGFDYLATMKQYVLSNAPTVLRSRNQDGSFAAPDLVSILATPSLLPNNTLLQHYYPLITPLESYNSASLAGQQPHDPQGNLVPLTRRFLTNLAPHYYAYAPEPSIIHNLTWERDFSQQGLPLTAAYHELQVKYLDNHDPELYDLSKIFDLKVETDGEKTKVKSKLNALTPLTFPEYLSVAKLEANFFQKLVQLSTRENSHSRDLTTRLQQRLAEQQQAISVPKVLNKAPAQYLNTALLQNQEFNQTALTLYGFFNQTATRDFEVVSNEVSPAYSLIKLLFQIRGDKSINNNDFVLITRDNTRFKLHWNHQLNRLLDIINMDTSLGSEVNLIFLDNPVYKQQLFSQQAALREQFAQAQQKLQEVDSALHHTEEAPNFIRPFPEREVHYFPHDAEQDIEHRYKHMSRVDELDIDPPLETEFLVNEDKIFSPYFLKLPGQEQVEIMLSKTTRHALRTKSQQIWFASGCELNPFLITSDRFKQLLLSDAFLIRKSFLSALPTDSELNPEVNYQLSWRQIINHLYNNVPTRNYRPTNLGEFLGQNLELTLLRKLPFNLGLSRRFFEQETFRSVSTKGTEHSFNSTDNASAFLLKVLNSDNPYQFSDDELMEKLFFTLTATQIGGADINGYVSGAIKQAGLVEQKMYYNYLLGYRLETSLTIAEDQELSKIDPHEKAHPTDPDLYD